MTDKSDSKHMGVGGITVMLTTGLMVWLSPNVAAAYTSTVDPVAQMRILRFALSDGTALPVSDVQSRIDEKQMAYNDAHRPKIRTRTRSRGK